LRIGRVPDALMYALCAAVRCVRLALGAEEPENEAARRAAIGISPLRRRRRRERNAEEESSESADGVPDPTLG
jgi:hypothetical protein